MLKKTRIACSLGLLASAAWAATYATFTDEATATSTFTTGTIDLVLSAEADDAYAFTTLEMTDMKPGAVQYAPLTIANPNVAGNLDFTYDMATSATNTDSKNLRDQLTLGIKLVADTGSCDAAGYGASGTTLTASGALSAAAIASRALAVNSSEVACFRVELPSDSDDTYQGAATTATFTFTATQA